MTMNSNLFFKNDLLFSKMHLVSYSTNVACNKARNGHQLAATVTVTGNYQLLVIYEGSSTSLPKDVSTSVS